MFEEGVDGYVPYAGSLYDNVSLTIAKLRATMISCGAITLPSFHETRSWCRCRTRPTCRTPTRSACASGSSTQ